MTPAGNAAALRTSLVPADNRTSTVRLNLSNLLPMPVFNS
jgi:hypothetical protein